MKKFHSLLIPSFVICFLSFVILPSYAQLKDLIVNADKISFEKEKHRMEAEGSVEVAYKDILARGNHLIYNTSAETIFFDRGFSLSFEAISVEGATLNYKIQQRSGQASKARFFYRGVQLSGQSLALDPEKLQLKGASFTTCDIADPHYRVTAADLTFYPGYGWLVAYWGFFWLGQVPIVPMPTYIYDFQAEEKAQRNLPPFPEVGSNDEDGSYINEKLAWHLRREFSGIYSLGYAANKGFTAGIDANYIINDRNEGLLRLNWNPRNRLFGGLTHNFDFGGEIVPSEKSMVDFFGLPRYRQYELETEISYKERINYQRVSFYPNLSLRSRSGEIMRKEAKYDLEILAGMVAEEGNAKLARGGGSFKFYGDFQETALGYISPSFLMEARFYSNGTKWIRPSAGLDLVKSFLRDLAVEMNYAHYFYVEGQSPFNFEMYRFRAADHLRSNLLFKVGETGAKMSGSYYLDNGTPEDLDYSLFFKLHCYNLAVTYRSLRREFALGFSLAAR